MSNNPFETIYDADMLHITFFGSKPIITEPRIEKEGDISEIRDSAAYLYIRGTYHKTKLSNAFFEKKLKTTCTTRNLHTCKAILALL